MYFSREGILRKEGRGPHPSIPLAKPDVSNPDCRQSNNLWACSAPRPDSFWYL